MAAPDKAFEDLKKMVDSHEKTLGVLKSDRKLFLKVMCKSTCTVCKVLCDDMVDHYATKHPELLISMFQKNQVSENAGLVSKGIADGSSHLPVSNVAQRSGKELFGQGFILAQNVSKGHDWQSTIANRLDRQLSREYLYAFAMAVVCSGPPHPVTVNNQTRCELPCFKLISDKYLPTHQSKHVQNCDTCHNDVPVAEFHLHQCGGSSHEPDL